MTFFFGNQKDYSFQPPSCIPPDNTRINYEIEPFPKNEYWPSWNPGVYNVFYDAYIHSPNILACPEMMCGVPELVTATIAGFQAAVVLPENSIQEDGNISVANLCIDELIKNNSLSDGDPFYAPAGNIILDGNWLFPATRFNGGIPKWNKGKTYDYDNGIYYAGESVNAPETFRYRKLHTPIQFNECEILMRNKSSNNFYYYLTTTNSMSLGAWNSVCGAPTVVWPNLGIGDPWPRLNNKSTWLENNEVSPRPTFYDPGCLAGGAGSETEAQWEWQKIYDGGQLVECKQILSPGVSPPAGTNTGLYPIMYDHNCSPDPNYTNGPSEPGWLLPWATYDPSNPSNIIVNFAFGGIGSEGALNKIIGFSDIPGFYNEGTQQYDIVKKYNGWRNQSVCGLKWTDILQSSDTQNSGLQILKKILNRPPNRTTYSYAGDIANTFWYDEDLNGEYKCYRTPEYFRPELIPTITRNNNSFPSGYQSAKYPKEWDAELLFELIGKPKFYLRQNTPCLDYTSKPYELQEYKTEPTPESSLGILNSGTIMLKYIDEHTGNEIYRSSNQIDSLYANAFNVLSDHNMFRIIGGSGSLSNIGKEPTFLNRQYNNSSYWTDNMETFTDGGFVCVDYRTSPRKINTGEQWGFLETCFDPAGGLSTRGPDKEIGLSLGLNRTLPCAANLPSAPLGTVKPHLIFRSPNPALYDAGIHSEGPEPEGNGAILFPILKASKYLNYFEERAELSEYPTQSPPGRSRLYPGINIGEDTHAYAWKLDKVEILDGGSGYMIGDIFVLDYDPDKFFLPYVNGQSILVFPDDECCYELSNLGANGNKRLTWSDTGGYTKVQRPLLGGSACGGGPPEYLSNPPIVYQRIRVSKVDDNGKILAVEILPWRKSYAKISICVELNKTTEQDYYVEYTRFLCHPRSVTYGGKYYNIGDTIIWNCDESIENCEVWNNNYASGIVVDVDENGSILDWHINGSEITKWDNLFSDDPALTTQYGAYNIADGAPCYGWVYTLDPDPNIPPNPRNEPTGIEPDERGSYRFRGQNLCSLSWQGVGVPVRTTTWEVEFLGDTTYEGTSESTSVNSSNITAININITRQYCETTANIAVKPWLYSEQILSDAEFSTFTKDDKQYASINNNWYKLNFAPYPKCNGGGAEIELIYGVPLANDSVYGSTIKSANVISPGSLYAFVDKVHQPPILPTGVELIAGSGKGASISNFTFNTNINNFPNLNYITLLNSILPFTLNSKRFSYFPVTEATLFAAGSGYEIGQTFIIQPDDVVIYSDAWSIDGGDNPDKVKNGGKYTGPFAKLVKDSTYMPDIDCIQDPNPPNDISPSCQEIKDTVPHCVLKVESVGPNGEITGLTVEHGGMMYRPVWTNGIKNPDAVEEITSTLGYGAKPTAIVNTDKNSKLFGTLTNFNIGQYSTQEFPDPYFPNIAQPIPGNSSMGYGRDYANPSLGSFWMLQDISDHGGQIGTNYKLLAHYDWGFNYKGLREGGYGLENVGYYTPRPLSPGPTYNSSHTIVASLGSLPQFQPKSTICSFDDCYHDLLNRQYPLYRQSIPATNPATWPANYRPKHNYVALSGDNPQFILIEHGFTLTLQSDRPETHPNTTWPNPVDGFGRTFSTPINGTYDVYKYR